MKVYNITDVATDKLKQHGVVNQQIVVDTALIAPGGSAEIADSAHTRSQMAHLLNIGALAVDKLPPSYASEKAKNVAPVAAKPSVIDAKHFEEPKKEEIKKEQDKSDFSHEHGRKSKKIND